MTDKTIAYADQLIAEAQKDPMNLANFMPITPMFIGRPLETSSWIIGLNWLLLPNYSRCLKSTSTSRKH